MDTVSYEGGLRRIKNVGFKLVKSPSAGLPYSKVYRPSRDIGHRDLSKFSDDALGEPSRACVAPNAIPTVPRGLFGGNLRTEGLHLGVLVWCNPDPHLY